MLKLITHPYTIISAVSIALTSFVSAIVAFAVHPWFPHFKEIFLLTTASQFILFFILNTILQRRDEAQYIQTVLENKKDLIIAAKSSCAYCKQTNDVSINFEQDNNFRCEYCGLDNSLKIQIIAAQIVKPVENVASNIVNAVKQQS
jgi:hypothetical protein